MPGRRCEPPPQQHESDPFLQPRNAGNPTNSVSQTCADQRMLIRYATKLRGGGAAERIDYNTMSDKFHRVLCCSLQATLSLWKQGGSCNSFFENFRVLR